MASIKEQTVESTKWVMLEKFSRQGVSFLFSIIMARILSPEDFGVLSLITVILNLTLIFVDSGLSMALIRKNNRTNEDLSTVFYFNVFIAVVLYLFLIFISPLLAIFFKMPILEDVIKIQAISVIFNSFAAVQVAILTIRLDFKTLAKASFMSSIISSAFAIIVAFAGAGIWALVWQSLLFSILNFFFVIYSCRWFPLLTFSTSSFKELGGFGSKLLLSSIIHTLYQELTTILIGRFYSVKELGYYNRGSEFAKMPISTINGVLQKITYPILAKIQDDTDRLINVYRKYIKVCSILIFIICACIAALSKPIIILVLGDKWLESIIYLQIFSLTFMFDHISSINLNLLKVVGKSGLFLKLEVIKKTISIIMLLIAVPFGVLSICFALFLYNQVAIVINTYYTGKLFNLGYYQQFKDFGKYLFFSLLACTPAYALTFTHIHYVPVLLMGLPLSLFLYYIILRKDELMIEIMDLLTNKLTIILNFYFRKR